MAVYTEVSDDELRAFLAEYDIGELISSRPTATPTYSPSMKSAWPRTTCRFSWA